MTLQKQLEGLSDYRPSERARIVQALADFRKQWQQLVKGGSLVKVEAPVGLILADIAEKLELTPQERYVMLGGKLSNEVDSMLEERIIARLPL